MPHIHPTPGSPFEAIHTTLTTLPAAENRRAMAQAATDLLDLIESQEDYHDTAAARHFLCE